MSSPRKVLHVDLDAFFCSVEEILDPSLKGKAFVVGGRPDSRGVVASASYPARQFGIRSAMPTAQAVRLCPGLIVLSSHRKDYAGYSHQIMELLRDSAPLIEQLSIDEAFLDVTGDRRAGEEIARHLQEAISGQFHLPTSWGAASNKLVAKIATEVGKPKGLVVVPAGEEEAFLAPLPVGMLWGVGPKTQASLADLGIQTIGGLAQSPIHQLRPVFGERASELIARARGEDDRPVEGRRDPKSISGETTFARDLSERRALEGVLRELSEEVGRRLRAEGFSGSTVRLKLRWPDFTTITRQTRTAQPTNLDLEIFETVLGLFDKVWRTGRPVRLLGVGVADLAPPIRQLGLFESGRQQDENLVHALDEIRQKYGKHALRRASQLEERDPDPKEENTG